MTQGRAEGRRIVVVDDSEITLTVVRAWLESKGWTVFDQTTPFGVSQVVMREQPDIVLLDIDMPALRGPALAKVISKQSPQVPIVFHSGVPPAELAKLARDENVRGAIPKGLKMDAFIAALDALLG